MRYLTVGIVLVLAAAGVHAATATVSFKYLNDEGGVDLDSDGCYIEVGPELSNTHHDTYCLITNTDASGKDTHVSLIAWKGMFSYIPAITSRDDIVSATLKIYQRTPVGGEVIAVDRITTNWLLQEAGTNEALATGEYIDGSSTQWAGGASGFTSADYTTEDQVFYAITENNPGKPNTIDVTEMVKDMFESGDYGFVIRLVSPDNADLWWEGDEKDGLNAQGQPEPVEYGDDGYLANPTLYITYTTEDTYTLTVNSGTGGGKCCENDVVGITADAHPSGLDFAEWVGDTAALDDPGQSTTNVTMPAADITVTATYALDVPPCTPCNGDLDDSGFVGQADLDIVLDQWGNGDPPNDPLTDSRADPSGDGFVGQADLDIVLDDWGKSCEED